MDARQQRILASARWITIRARVLTLMRRALQASCEALPDGDLDEGEPTPRNALMLHERGE
jgi:hypothetical protein